MNIVIRADSSVAIGSGHIMRCLTLAECLRDHGATVAFVCRSFPGNIANLAKKQGFHVFGIGNTGDMSWETDAAETIAVIAKFNTSVDWLIVDHYSLDIRWEKVLRAHTSRIMVIDDLADRRHKCDLLLDTNYFHQPDARYAGLVPANAELLLGPQYALLRSEFSGKRALRKRSGRVDRVFVFFGGSDPTNETGKTLLALSALPERTFALDVVVGGANPYKEEIRRQCSQLNNTNFFCQVQNMAEIMARADLAIGAGGTTIWERCYLGLPSIIIAVAANQIATAQALDDAGAIQYLGFHTTVDVEMIRAAITQIIVDHEALLSMSRQAKLIVPKNGTEQVIQRMSLQNSDGYVAYGNNVLITSASKKIPLLQVVKKAMGKLAGEGKLVVADSNEQCIASYFADNFWQMPPLTELTDDILLTGLKQYGIRYVIPTRDGELLFWSNRRDWLQEHNISVMVSDPRVIHYCLDKLEFYRRCRELEIPAIETVDCIDQLAADRYVVKEQHGAGSQNIGLNLTWTEARQHAAKLQQPIFQPYIIGRELSADAYVDRMGRIKGVVCRSRDYTVNGESQVTTLVHDERLEHLCAGYIEKLQLYGHVVLQLIVGARQEVHLIECNSRFGGASTLGLSAGLDSLFWFLLESSGEDIKQYPFNKTVRTLRQVRYPSDIIMDMG